MSSSGQTARRVVVTGSESTGKTTLASDLARHFGTIWVREFARVYYDEKTAATGLPLDETDVEPIARGQIAAEDKAIAGANGIIVLDTDLMSTMIYARHYYGRCPPWIERLVEERRADLYLLCDIDVPWVAGPPRDRPHLRAHMHGLFVDALQTLGARYTLIRGDWADRLDKALTAVTIVAKDARDSSLRSE